jgi:hypothetical protein
VRIVAEATIELNELLVNEAVPADVAFESGFFDRIRQLAMQQQKRRVIKIAFRRQLLDGVASVQQNALISIDIGN